MESLEERGVGRMSCGVKLPFHKIIKLYKVVYRLVCVHICICYLK